MRTGALNGLLVAAAVLATVPGCRRKPPPPPPAPAVTVPDSPAEPWAWHKVGGVLVVTGEADKPLDLVLKGRYLNERTHAEFGPMRWEMYAPPQGEVAELRTGEGVLLARWDFDHPLPEPAQAPPAPRPAAAQAKPRPRAPRPAGKATPTAPSVAPTAAKLQPPRPWPDTHLPLAKGPAPRPLKVAKAALPAPRPVPAPAPLPAPAKPQPPRPWPDTHLPLAKGPAPRPLKVAKAAPPAPRPVPAPVPPLAPVKPQPPRPWPDTHLPLAQGPAPRPLKAAEAAPAPRPVPPPAPLVPREAPRTALPAPPAAEPTPPPRPALPPDLSMEWPGAGEALNLVRGPRGSHWVCLTFDGGSTAEVAADVLDALKERGIRTTFFLTGAFIQKYPDLVRRIDREGHEIGNHTMDHPHFAPRGRRDPRWTKDRFQQQLLQADALLLKLLGRPMDPYWRAPYGENTAELRKWAEELGYRHVYWSEGADTLDWATPKERRLYHTGDAILDRLHERMGRNDGDGLIVLMHLGSGRPESDRPARVLGPFLDRALDEGWNFVNIGAYLKEAGKPVWNSSRRLATLGQNAARQ